MQALYASDFKTRAVFSKYMLKNIHTMTTQWAATMMKFKYAFFD